MQQYSKNAVGCTDCVFYHDCGGLPAGPGLWGCFSQCLAACNPETCDLTCPNNPRLFAPRLEEIGGISKVSAPGLKVPLLRLPAYIPKIHNGSCRTGKLRFPVAAIPARALLHKSGRNVSCRFRTLGQAREHFGLSDRTACIISCISTDDDVEDFWDGLNRGMLAREFARLKPAAVIAPNYSFFSEDVPRVHTLYNRKRIALASRLLSDAGCRVIIPVSAMTSNDWEFWHSLLRENPTMKYVAKEFQTGLRRTRAGTQAIKDLSQLQDRLARPLHPVAVGGRQYTTLFSTYFSQHTILDSRPFLLAAKRKRVVRSSCGEYSEVTSPTAPDEPIDELLQWNVQVYSSQFV